LSGPTVDRSGSVIGIDFGVAFGMGLQVLPIPELFPFRLTRQFTGSVTSMIPFTTTIIVIIIVIIIIVIMIDWRSCPSRSSSPSA
jgi:hypothetical protein